MAPVIITNSDFYMNITLYIKCYLIKHFALILLTLNDSLNSTTNFPLSKKITRYMDDNSMNNLFNIFVTEPVSSHSLRHLLGPNPNQCRATKIHTISLC